MVTFKQAFDNPNHRKSEELSFQAERLDRQGKHDEATKLYQEAALLEARACSELATSGADEKTISLFITSADTLFKRYRGLYRNIKGE